MARLRPPTTARSQSRTGRERHPARFRAVLTMVLATGLLAAACGDSSGGSAPEATGAALSTATTAATSAPATSAPGSSAITTGPTTSTPPPTTASTTSSTPPPTTAPTTTSSSTPPTTAPTTTTDVTALAEGSGCTPGSTTLPDGRWFGLVDSADATSVSFDLACWFTGDPAAVAAAQDGEESPPPNDYYIRNTNPMLRNVPVAALAEVAWMPNPGDPSTVEVVGYPEWLANRSARSFQPPVWLNIEGGEIISIEEQYIP